MDTFVHAAFGILAGSRSGLARLRIAPPAPPWRDWTLYAAAAFGMLPDLSSFGAFLVQRVLQGDFSHGKPPLESIPAYVFVNYNLTHSLLIALAIGLMLWIGCRKWFMPFLAWPLHILCDIQTHSGDYFATPLLWPLSNWKFDGWSFAANPGIVLGYWLIAAMLYTWIWRSGKLPLQK